MSSILNADHLAEQEQAYIEAVEAGEVPQSHGPITFEQVVDHFRRLRFLHRLKAELKERLHKINAPLLAEIDRNNRWYEEEVAKLDKRIAFNEAPIILYFQMNPPYKSKTLKFPGGRVSARTTRGKIAFADDKLAAYQLEKVAPQFVRHTPAVDKQAIYEAMNAGKVRVEGEQVYVITDDGEMVLLEGAKWEAPQEQYAVKVEEG